MKSSKFVFSTIVLGLTLMSTSALADSIIYTPYPTNDDVFQHLCQSVQEKDCLKDNIFARALHHSEKPASAKVETSAPLNNQASVNLWESEIQRQADRDPQLPHLRGSEDVPQAAVSDASSKGQTSVDLWESEIQIRAHRTAAIGAQ